MKLHEYKVLNADNENVGRVLLSSKNDHAASEKIYHKFGAKSYFLRKQYVGFNEIDSR